MAPVKLGYWSVRGLGQPIRMLLGYTNTDFEDVLYHEGDGPEFSHASWLNVKETLGLDFPNDANNYGGSSRKCSAGYLDGAWESWKGGFLKLPYLIDGDIKLTQSNAILRYIARKNKLDGETDEEKRIVDMLENQAMDFRLKFGRFIYYSTAANVEENRVQYEKDATVLLARFEKFLGEKKFFAGEKLTYVDFVIYEVLYTQYVYKSALLEPFSKLQAFYKRFEEIPQVSAFMKSEKCFKGSITGKMAQIKI